MNKYEPPRDDPLSTIDIKAFLSAGLYSCAVTKSFSYGFLNQFLFNYLWCQLIKCRIVLIEHIPYKCQCLNTSSYSMQFLRTWLIFQLFENKRMSVEKGGCAVTGTGRGLVKKSWGTISMSEFFCVLNALQCSFISFLGRDSYFDQLKTNYKQMSTEKGRWVVIGTQWAWSRKSAGDCQCLKTFFYSMQLVWGITYLAQGSGM